MWGLHPPPIQCAADSQLFPCSPLRGPETPVRGISFAKPLLQQVHICFFFFQVHVIKHSFNRIRRKVLFWESPARPVVLMWVQHPVTRAAFLGHSPRMFIYSQLRPRKSRPLSPVALPGRPLPSCPAPPSHVHFRVTRSSHQPGAGCPFCPWEASVVSSG